MCMSLNFIVVFICHVKKSCVYMSYKNNWCVYISSNIKQHMYTSVIFWCIPYRNNLLVWYKKFCFGISYFLQYKSISFCLLSTVGVPINLREDAPSRTYQETESLFQLSDPGLFDFQMKIWTWICSSCERHGTNEILETRNWRSKFTDLKSDLQKN